MQWKCNNNNARGLQLLNFAIKTDLDIIAPNSPTRYGHNSTSTIDLAVIKNFLFPYQISSIAELSSDHNPVELTFNFDYLIPTENSNIFTNWTLFTKFLTSIHAKPLPTITSTFTLDEEINKFTNDLLTARQNASKPATNDKKPWTHPNIKKLLQVRNKAKKKWQTTRNPNDKTILNRIHKNIKNAFKRYSDNKWKETLEDLQIEDGSFWKMTKRFKLPFIKMSHLQGTISTAIKDQHKAELIAQNLENQFTLNDISDPMQDPAAKSTVLSSAHRPIVVNQWESRIALRGGQELYKPSFFIRSGICRLVITGDVAPAGAKALQKIVNLSI
ncbi:hypothetical protein CDAR_239651 [Caerostris darwini]|uniref:Endonuclease/exonuclease/phosphatase domain-containing protein n=1 Tax=Caerostris darwini TaxID=1538125 RepID=A0AAV4SRH8_9ARAC|nr:hypothetical protein CDAR_239651 [Caerostris darwini]